MAKKIVFFIMMTFIMAVPFTAWGGPIDDLQPGHWYEVPNSHINDVLPSPEPPGDNGPGSITGGWSGGAYDSKRDRFIIWGGGHGDYAGNEIYTFDINTLKWSRTWGPTPNNDIRPNPGGSTCYDTYLDGNPSSRHTYEGLEYIPTIDKFWAQGGSRWCGPGGGSDATWTFNFDTSAWTRMSEAPDSMLGVLTDYDPVTQHVFHQGKVKFSEYNPQTDTWTIRAKKPTGTWDQDRMTGAIDPNNRIFIAIGHGYLRTWDLNSWTYYTTKSASGCSKLISAYAPGLAYDPVDGHIIAWAGGTSVYRIDTNSLSCSEITDASTNSVTPTSPASKGTYGRFRYIPSKNAYIVVNSIKQNVFIYKLSDGVGAPPPIDSVAPSVSISNPLASSTVSGTVPVSASASDSDSGVANVQFKLDGADLGPEDTSAPYSASWDTTSVPDGWYVLRAVATDYAGNIAQTDISVNVSNAVSPPPPPGNQIDIPLKTWIKRDLQMDGTSPRGGKHMRLAHNPVNSRIYLFGGDYGATSIGQISGRNEMYSYSILNDSWIMEHPYCVPSGSVQPMHPDQVGWVYDTNRDKFWMLPGYHGADQANCSSTFVRGEIMTFDPITKKWSRPNIRLSRAGEKRSFAQYDPVSDTIIRFENYMSSPTVWIYNIKSNLWSSKGLGGTSSTFGYEYSAMDLKNRAIYLISSTAPESLYRYNMDSKTIDVIADLPLPDASLKVNTVMIAWDSVNDVLLFPYIADYKGYVTLYIFHPDTMQWETDSMYQPDGLSVRGNAAVFDPTQNVLMLIGGRSNDSGIPSNYDVFLYRYENGDGSSPPIDSTPPTQPQSLNATAQSEFTINLSWSASTDNESQVSYYNIYRNGSYIDSSSTTSLSDTSLTENTEYSYQVTAVSNGGESIKSTTVNETTYGDSINPSINSVDCTISTRVTIVFSEQIEKASAVNLANYYINNNITVTDAALSSDNRTVVLTTDTHSEGITYTIVVNNVIDRASVPNTIAANSSGTYSYTSQLTISNLVVSSGEIYEVVSNGLTEGETVYIDRSYTYTNVPSSLENATFIRTANDDKTSSSGSFITFDVNRDVTVYIAHDNKISVKPSWVSTFFDTGVNLVASNTTLSLYYKSYAAGTIVLGGNESSGHSMYSIIVIPGSGVFDIEPPASPSGLLLVVP